MNNDNKTTTSFSSTVSLAKKTQRPEEELYLYKIEEDNLLAKSKPRFLRSCLQSLQSKFIARPTLNHIPTNSRTPPHLRSTQTLQRQNSRRLNILRIPPRSIVWNLKSSLSVYSKQHQRRKKNTPHFAILTPIP